MRINSKLFIGQYVDNNTFFLDKFRLREFVFMNVISVEGFLIKQA